MVHGFYLVKGIHGTRLCLSVCEPMPTEAHGLRLPSSWGHSSAPFRQLKIVCPLHATVQERTFVPGSTFCSHGCLSEGGSIHNESVFHPSQGPAGVPRQSTLFLKDCIPGKDPHWNQERAWEDLPPRKGKKKNQWDIHQLTVTAVPQRGGETRKLGVKRSLMEAKAEGKVFWRFGFTSHSPALICLLMDWTHFPKFSLFHPWREVPSDLPILNYDSPTFHCIFSPLSGRGRGDIRAVLVWPESTHNTKMVTAVQVRDGARGGAGRAWDAQERRCHSTFQTRSYNKVFYHHIPTYASCQSLCYLLLVSPHPGLTLFSLLLPPLSSLAAQPLNRTSHTCTLSTTDNPPTPQPAHSCMLSMLINPASSSTGRLGAPTALTLGGVQRMWQFRHFFLLLPLSSVTTVAWR